MQPRALISQLVVEEEEKKREDSTSMLGVGLLIAISLDISTRKWLKDRG